MTDWIITAGLVVVIVLGVMENKEMRNMEVRIRILEEFKKMAEDEFRCIKGEEEKY